MRKMILFALLASLFTLLSIPAFAQGTSSGAASDQYEPGAPDLSEIAEDVVEDFVQNGGDANGAAAYEAALNAVKEAGADNETAEKVATEAVADVSGSPEPSEESGGSGEPEITELPDTGGAPVFGLGILAVVAGTLVWRLQTRA